MGDSTFTVTKKGSGRKLSDISYNGQKVEGYFIDHGELQKGGELVISTAE